MGFRKINLRRVSAVPKTDMAKRIKGNNKKLSKKSGVTVKRNVNRGNN